MRPPPTPPRTPAAASRSGPRYFRYRSVKDAQGRSDEKWTTETLHCTTKTITGLQPATLYAFEIRARNSAGVGDLAPRHIIKTPNADQLLAKINRAAKPKAGAAAAGA